MTAIVEFSKKLRKLRELKNLKQEELGKELGVSRGSISFYENADRIPDIEFLYKVSLYFDVSADWLIGLRPGTSDSVIADQTGLTEDSIYALRNMDKETLVAFNAFLSKLK